MNMFPFFIECSKHYQNEPHKQKFLQKLAFGHGIHIIKRKDKSILVTSNGEFVIPTVYSDKARRDLASKLWEVNDFTRLGDCIEDTRRTWHTARKKDKIDLPVPDVVRRVAGNARAVGGAVKASTVAWLILVFLTCLN